MRAGNRLINGHLPEPEDKLLKCFHCVKRQGRVGDCQMTITTERVPGEPPQGH